ncbi:MAG: T9SS type A sorting domain-containing protein, partial [Saprospiraceae bacterium]
NMLNMFLPYKKNISTIIDDSGRVCLPYSGYNTIGNWNYKKAYKISTSSGYTMQNVFCGKKIVPENEVLSMRFPELNFIPYLRDSPKPIKDELLKYANKIKYVKDLDASTFYYPDASINYGELEPFKGYVLLAKTPFNLTYSANFNSPITREGKKFKYTDGIFFRTKFSLTHNATVLVITKDIAAQFLKLGDEIAVFNELNEICGSSIYSGEESFLLKIWGDNEITSEKDGLVNSESMIFKKFSSSSKSISELDFSFSDNNINRFDPNIVYMVSSVEVKGTKSISIYPNPTKESIFISGPSSMEAIEIINNLGQLKLKVINKDNSKLIKISTSGLIPGNYYIRVTNSDSGPLVKKIMIID